MHDLDRQQLEQYEQEGLLGEYELGEMTEAQELELASELLEIASEEELEEFLGDVWKRVSAGAKSAYNSDLAQKYVIPTVMRYAPVAVDAAAQAILPPGVDVDAFRRTQQLLQMGKAKLDATYGKELEGLSAEDREFEIARSYVRFAIEALRRALQTPPRVPKPVAAQIAVREAARQHAPGLVANVPAPAGTTPLGNGSNGAMPSGRWVRQGSSIVIDLG